MTRGTAGKPLVELSKVRVTFEDGRRSHEHALSDVTLRFLEGDAVGVLGPSGCGKTTLLRVIAGQRAVSSGEARFHPDAAKPGQFGYMSQSNSLLPWLSLFENVRFPLSILGRSAGAGERVARILREVGLEGHERKYPEELSGGMARRAVLARTLIYEPSVLLLDEPFAGLDAATRDSLVDLLTRLRTAHGFSLICVEHDVQAAARLATKFLVFKGPGTPPEWIDCAADSSVAERERLVRSTLASAACA
ncbi:MAG: ATP-binding cassette domain-containing protein [Elusimicrobia bacterium]|nr:ATP-binding cassette domain-containing protein [Elusimicrobiota bacterium]